MGNEKSVATNAPAIVTCVDVRSIAAGHFAHIGQSVGGTGTHTGLGSVQDTRGGICCRHGPKSLLGGLHSLDIRLAVRQEGSIFESLFGNVVGSSNTAKVNSSVGTRIYLH
jgi:hypothetical protein